ncbi:hypothetical protein J437_LFUL010380, partial [Ladona fulva]
DETPGWDKIRTRNLRHKNILDPVLSNLVNNSLKSSIMPAELKTSIIIPIYKEGLKSNPNNYMPISIQPSINKVMERHKIKGTKQALEELPDFVYHNLDNRMNVLVAFIDLCKAIDCVDVNLLLKKLFNIGCPRLEQVTNYNYLCIEINNTFNFKMHINKVNGNLRKVIYMFHLIKNYLTLSVFK